MEANTGKDRQREPITNEKRMPTRDAKELAPFELDRRLMEEINILKLEGVLFCFDPREAKRRRGVLTLTDALKRPVTVRINPDLGQPSVLAYKVLQAIFLKLSEQGCEPTEDGRCIYNRRVSFSKRELANLVGRSWAGKKMSDELYEAIMQLQSTIISASLYDKEDDTWEMVSFAVLPTAYFSGRKEMITRCAMELHPKIIDSLNRRHVALFNLRRLNQLDTLGLVLYKHVFFHLSNLMHFSKPRMQLKFTKNYEAICQEWLGNVKVLKHRSRILNDQLGRHLDGLVLSGLVRRYAVEPNKAGDGFNITFYPGSGFFDDYEAFYEKSQKPRLVAQVADLQEVKALELVAHFHRKLGRLHTKFQDHETSYADELLTTHSEEEIRDLVAYAVQEAQKTKFDMAWFNALKRFVPEWSIDQARQRERRRRAKVTDDCQLCDDGGFLRLQVEGSNRIVAHLCPHRVDQVTAIEERLRASRV